MSSYATCDFPSGVRNRKNYFGEMSQTFFYRIEFVAGEPDKCNGIKLFLKC